MNAVDELYNLVGFKNMWVEEYQFHNIDTIQIYYNSYNEMINAMMKKNDWTRKETIEVAKRECRKGHPPFTAEKQLALIKWLIKEKYFIGRYVENYDLFTNSMLGYNSQNKNFELALAGLINNLWQDLTEEEKQQVKGILE